MIARSRALFPFLMKEAGEGDEVGGQSEEPRGQEPDGGFEIELPEEDDPDDDEPGEPSAAPQAAPEERPTRKQRRRERGVTFKTIKEQQDTIAQLQSQLGEVRGYLTAQARQPQPQYQPGPPQEDPEEAELNRIRQQKQDLVTAFRAKGNSITAAEQAEAIRRSEALDFEAQRINFRRFQKESGGDRPQQPNLNPTQIALLTRHPELSVARVNNAALGHYTVLKAELGRDGMDVVEMAIERAKRGVLGNGGRQPAASREDPSLRRKLVGMAAGGGGGREEEPSSRKVKLNAAEVAMGKAWGADKGFKGEKELLMAYHRDVLVPRDRKRAAKAAAKANKSA